MGKQTMSEIDGVNYRKAKLWQIILYSCNSLVGMSVYILIGYASYAASIGFGISTAVIGIILTGSRILDGITDPLLALLYDRVDTKFGRLRVLIIGGFLVEAIALILMFSVMSSKGFGIPVFVLLYILYVIGYTITNMTAQTVPAIMSNDPKQRPTIGVWSTAFNYVVPMLMTVILTMVLLPKFGTPNGDQFDFNQSFFTAAVWVTVLIAFVGVILVCIGISSYDKPEYYKQTKKYEPLKIRDMWAVLKNNKPLQSYIAAQASDKLAQQTSSQSVIQTLMMGIIIGNLQLGTILSVIGMLPSIIFAVLGAKYAGKNGSRKSVLVWSIASIGVAVVTTVFFFIIDPKKISTFGPCMILYVVLTLLLNGTKMCVTTANNAMMADLVDYEFDRSGKYIPAVVTGTYSLIDKIISAFGATIATGAIALIGYKNTVPQPTDPSTPTIFMMTMLLYYGLPIIGWIISIIAMKNCKLTKEEMVEVQKRIENKKKEVME